MSDDLKRIGLIFEEEGSTNFVQRLKLVNSTLKENYATYKLVQEQYDKNTSSTQKLKDKLEYLSNAYELQSQKVLTLKAELEELEKAEDRDEVAISKKKVALANAESALEKYKKQLKDVSTQLELGTAKMLDFGNKLESAGKKVENVGEKLSVLSAATAAAGGFALKAAIDYESAFTGVEKTVDGTTEELKELRQGIKDMSEELPSSSVEIAEVAEVAGQLGIKTKDILSFTKVMVDMGNSTNLSAEEAASSLAKFANVTNMSAKDYDRLGSSIVALGNNFATTETDIVEMSTRLASTGEITGLTQSQILALAAALSSAGIEAEAGGSAMAKLLKKLNLANETYQSAYNEINKTGKSLRELQLMAANNSSEFKELSDSIGLTADELKNYMKNADSLEDFARVAGLTVEEFQKLYSEDSVKALSAFIGGLQDTQRNGKGAVEILNEMGLTEVRLSNAILSMTTSSSLMNDAINVSNDAWNDNTALTNEAGKRYNTLKSKIEITINKIKNAAETLGSKMMPVLSKTLDKVDNWIEKLKTLDEEQIETILKIGTLVVTIGPAISIIGKLTTGTGKCISSFAKFIDKIGTSNTLIGKLTKSLITMCGGTGPLIGVVSAIGLASIAIAEYEKKTLSLDKETQKLINTLNEDKNTRDTLLEAQQKNLNANLTEITNVQRLYYELKNLVDENGNVKQGYENRVNYILNELNSALGTEIQLNGNIINGYNELQGTIENTIRKKKAEIILASQEEAYASAIEKQSEAYASLNTLLEKRQSIQRSISQATNNKESAIYKIKLQEINNEIEKQQSLITGYANDIARYEADSMAIISGTEEELQTVINRTSFAYQKTTSDIGEAVNQQIQIEQQKLNTYKQLYDEQIQANNLINAQMYENQIQNQENTIATLSDTLVEATNKVNELTPNLTNAWQNLADRNISVYASKTKELTPEMQKELENITGIIINNTSIANATDMTMQQMLETVRTKNDSIVQDANITSEELKTSAENAVSSIANGANSKSPVVSATFKTIGQNAIDGFKINANEKNWEALGTTGAASFISAFKNKMDIHSPSKVMKKIGKNAIDGFEGGNPVDEYSKLANKNAKAFTDNFDNTLKNDYSVEEKGTGLGNIDLSLLIPIILEAIKNSGIIELLKSILINSKKNIYIDKNALVGCIADSMNVALAQISEKEKRG